MGGRRCRVLIVMGRRRMSGSKDGLMDDNKLRGGGGASN